MPESIQDDRLASLFQAHAAFVLRALRRLGVAPADLEDMTHEVFLVAHARLGMFDGAHPHAWLYAIARRVARDERGRAYRHREVGVDMTPETKTPAPQDVSLTRAYVARGLEYALQTLDDESREVFSLFEMEELPMRDVAEALCIPLKTAYGRLYSARRTMREALRKQGIDIPALIDEETS